MINYFSIQRRLCIPREVERFASPQWEFVQPTIGVKGSHYRLADDMRGLEAAQRMVWGGRFRRWHDLYDYRIVRVRENARGKMTKVVAL